MNSADLADAIKQASLAKGSPEMVMVPKAKYFALEARLAEAMEVLRSFAETLDDYDPTDEDDNTPGTFVAGSVTNYDLTLGDFRAARLLVEKEDGR